MMMPPPFSIMLGSTAWSMIYRTSLHVALLLLAGATLAQGAPAPLQRIAITVADENGVAVPSALVFLQLAPQAVALRCVTDFAGHCTFTNIGAGTYQVRVEKPGFYAITLPTVQVGAVANIDVTLSHQQEVKEVVNVVAEDRSASLGGAVSLAD